MRKLLVICGPTATGKTSLALNLAKKFNGELVSADSKQVYKRMDIGTGKDLPRDTQYVIRNTKLGGYYFINGVKIWGYDLVESNEEFSLGQYIKIAREIIKDIWNREKLPILVGGTGLYIKGVVNGIPTASIPKNMKLRKSLELKNTSELFKILTRTDPIKTENMNPSDKNNPRRLIRAIEIAFSKSKLENQKTSFRNLDYLFVGLKAKKSWLDKRIEERVFARLKQGIVDETKKLLSLGVSWESHSMLASGYRQLRDYFENKITLNEAVEKWIKAEKQYAKRQMTWFKKETYYQGEKRIRWFDISKKNWKKDVEKMVAKWYKC